MIQTLRQIKMRIKSITNTKKITKAMQMISAAKLNRVKTLYHDSKPYMLDLEMLLGHMLADSGDFRNPLLERRKKVNRVALCVMASDTGLCGTYNHNVIRQAERFIQERGKDTVELIIVGKEAFGHFRRLGVPITHSYLGMNGRYQRKIADELAEVMIGLFMSRKVDEVHVASTRFRPTLRHAAGVWKFLNIDFQHKNIKRHSYMYEPGRDEILESLIKRYLQQVARVALLEAFTTEHSARMLAMKMATDNVEELITTLELVKNKARQAAITKEVLEITMSAEALKG